MSRMRLRDRFLNYFVAELGNLTFIDSSDDFAIDFKNAWKIKPVLKWSAWL